jgi:hypothetical protein
LNHISEKFGSIIDVWWSLERNLQRKALVYEVLEITPVCTTGAEVRRGVRDKSIGGKFDEDRGMIRGEIKAGVSHGEIRGKTFCDTEVNSVRDLMRVRRPITVQLYINAP